MTACSAHQRAAGAAGTTVGVIDSGKLGSTTWAVNLVRDGAQTCTAAVVNGKEASRGCNPPLTAGMPMNFAIDRSAQPLVLVYGVVSGAVSRVAVQQSNSESAQTVRTQAFPSDPGHRYFAIGEQGVPVDLIAYSADGRVLESGKSKLAN